jgi:Tfp pilus assembly protein PilX
MSVRAGAGDRLRNNGATYAERGPALSILVIILIVIVVLAVLGFFGRGRF